jgi:hypothetical protein
LQHKPVGGREAGMTSMRAVFALGLVFCAHTLVGARYPGVEIKWYHIMGLWMLVSGALNTLFGESVPDLIVGDEAPPLEGLKYVQRDADAPRVDPRRAGVVTVVISGSKDRPLYSSSELLSFYESKTFEAYVVLTVVVMLLLSTVFILPLARSCAQHAQVRGNNASGAAEAAERERAPLAGEAAKPRAQSAPSYRSTDVVAEEGAAAAAGRSVGSSGRSFVPLQVEQFCATVLCGLCGANTNLLAKIAVMCVSRGRVRVRERARFFGVCLTKYIAYRLTLSPPPALQVHSGPC